MKMPLCRWLCCLIGGSALALSAVEPEMISAGTLPPPRVAGRPGFKVAFAPDFVACDLPRRFFVELEFPEKAVETRLAPLPEQIRLLDSRTLTQELDGKPARRIRRYYFETVAPGTARIGIVSEQGAVTVTVTVWGYADLRRTRKVNGMLFPRRYPLGGSLPYVKQRQVLPPLPPGSRKEPIRIGGFTAKRMHCDDAIVARDYSLEDIWRMAPDTSFTVRKNFPGAPCPIHGDRIYAASGDSFYSYRLPAARPGEAAPWKVYCPVGNHPVPDNDYAGGSFSGACVDDGVNGAEFGGKRHYFIGQLAVMRALQLYDLVAQCGDLYSATGDPKYAELALVGLCRIGVEHNMLSVLCQNRRSHLNIDQNCRLVDAVPFTRFGNTGFFFDGIWTTAFVRLIATAYDRVFPQVEKADAVLAFLQRKNFPVRTPDDLKRFIEENVFLTYLQGQLDEICNANYPQRPQCFTHIARILDYPTTEFVDRLYREGAGEEMALHRFWREGFKDESMGGYNVNGISHLRDLFAQVDAISDAHPGLFPPERYPRLTRNRRFLSGVLAQIRNATTPYTAVVIGDSGKLSTFRTGSRAARSYTGDEAPALLEAVFEDFPAPEIAWALLHTDGFRPASAEAAETMRRLAATLPAGWRCRPDDLSGPGVVLLRGGAGDAERTFYAHYGWLAHGHDSTMGIYLDALKTRLVTGWGYPAKLDLWYYNWMSNNTGRAFPASSSHKLPHRWRSATGGELYGWSEFAVRSGVVQAAGLRAATVRDRKLEKPGDRCFEVEPDGGQTRNLMMVNVSDTDFYTVDLYRIRGGQWHARSFGTLDGPVTVRGAALKKQPGGTLAGADVAYDDAAWVEQNGGPESALGFVRIRNVERGTAAGPFEAKWQLNGGDGAYLRLLGLDAGGGEIALGDAADRNGVYPQTRRMLFFLNRVRPGETSTVFNLIEAGRGEPLIVEALPLATDTPSGRAARIRLRDGRTDLVLIADDAGPHTVRLPDGRVFRLDGRAGLVRLAADGSVERMELIYGKALTLGDRTLTGRASWKATVVGVDPERWTLDLRPAFDDSAALAGRNLLVDRNGFRFALEIRAAENRDGVTRLTVGCSPVAGRYRVTGHGDGVLNLEGSTGRETPNELQFRRSGMELRGSSGARYIVETRAGYHERKDALRLLLRADRPELLAAARLAGEFPAGRMITVLDVAPGMAVEVPLSAVAGR